MVSKITIDLDDRKVSGTGIIYNIDLNQQRGENLCWAAVTESIYKHFNDHSFTQDKFTKTLNADKENEPYPLLENIYKKKGKDISQCIFKKPLNQKEFKYLIEEEGGPLIFTIPQMGSRCDSRHYILVIGYIMMKDINNRSAMHIIVKNPYPKSKKINRNKNINVKPTVIPFREFKQCGVLYTSILDDEKLNKDKCY